jgi:hypothetical protein
MTKTLHAICWALIVGQFSDLIFKWFSPGTPVSSTNNTDRHDIA